MPLVQLVNLCRSYGRVQALADVTLTLDEGTIGLVGNNGAGKSTLLKILLGLLAPDSGSGTILGYDVRHAARQLRGRIGYMSDSAAVVPLLKGVEYVTLSGDLYGMPHGDARRRAHEVLYYVGLGELRYRRLEEYSTGNLQRLKLAAALVHDPQVLLLDEPTNGLDPPGRADMLALVQDLIAETGKSVILCTHLLGDVERLCEQLVVLDRGTVVCAGQIDTLLQAVDDCYELAWTGGSGEKLQQRLVAQGAEWLPGATPMSALVRVPPAWHTREFFLAAEDAGTTIQRLRRDTENLERLFFRLTQSSERGAVATSGALSRESHSGQEGAARGA